MRVRTRPRLRTLLLLINLVILALPLAGLWFLRLYESALIRQTESELVAQGAVLAGAFKVERQRLVAADAPAETPRPVSAAARSPPGQATTRAPGLDLANDPVLPPPADPRPADRPASPLAMAVGQALTPILREAQPTTLAALRVIDRAGVIVGTTGEDLGLSLAGREEIDRALAGEPVSLMRYRERPARFVPGGISRGADLRVFVATPVLDGGGVVGAIVLSRTPRTVMNAIYGKLLPLLALAALLIGAGVVLAFVGSHLITRPLGTVIAQAQRVAAGEIGAVVPLSGPGVREAAELSAAVAQMAATLERRADYIRSFAAHVSHEFKTPLAGAKGAVELLGDHFAGMSEAERRHFLAVIAGGIDRLELLVRRLLDLARADMMRPGGAAPSALAPILQRLADRYGERGLHVTLPREAARIALATDALEITLGALLDNVVAHAGPGADVTIAATTEAGKVVLTVSDTGPGIAPGDAKRIFEPFFTTTREAGGTGLGLAIARAIVTGAGGSIELLPTDSGASFRLVLPA
jgi:signal transduction histidine kinase